MRSSLHGVTRRVSRSAAPPRAVPENHLGIYRFWRDLGYAIGALGLGLAAHLTGALEAAFWFVALSMFASGVVITAISRITASIRTESG